MSAGHPRSEDLKFVYSISDPPALLNLSDTDPILLSRPRLPGQSMAQLTVLTALNKAVMEKTEESGPSLTPSAMQVAMFDWIGVYPADFANLEDDYLTYVYAPPATSTDCHGSNTSGTEHADSNKATASDKSSLPTHISCHSGRVSARFITGLKNQSVVLVYWSRKKKCPQGYSSPIMVSVLLLFHTLLPNLHASCHPMYMIQNSKSNLNSNHEFTTRVITILLPGVGAS
ncbi:hypothetical protein FGIG_12629 [Fasciola gigantica]|uniref:SKICH domain-containing protein n=1 Tax=Fasciola gigantica TaxID=46835 RepID=A0A504YL43_FASGI|nr:hypothetical protein FGIG_12629 [Fasciola gigantica]